MRRLGSGKGYYITDKGYAKSTRRDTSGKYIHRLVMARLCRHQCYYPLGKDGLPVGFDVHHIDFDKLHNCPCNLLLMEHSLHFHADIDSRRVNGTYSAVAPDWVVTDTGDYDDGYREAG